MSGAVLGESAPTPAPGCFGKIPALGDFFSRRVPRDFVDPWDGWLQHCLLHSRDRLGERWLEVYLTSPVWRFALSADVCGPQPWAGVLIPSVDKVGRYFPFTLCTALGPEQSPLATLTEPWSAWFRESEALALSCLEDDFQLEAFEAALEANVPPVEDPSVPSPAGGPDATAPSRSAKPAWHQAIASADDAAACYPALTHRLLAEATGHFSLWWTNGSERVAPSLLAHVRSRAPYAQPCVAGRATGACRPLRCRRG